MIKLIESNLFGSDLIPVTSALMRKRYNACLENIGIAPTTLKEFHIDGWGWSPEIASKREDKFYLSHGVANPFGIIISPAQAHCPIYMPYHTFDWDIQKQIFHDYELQIKDITAGHAIWFELDQNISAYRTAVDLLMMELVNVHFNVPGDIQQAALHQKNLIKEYSNDDRAWLNTELTDKIIASSKLFGDLRYRNLQMPELPFANTSAYFTLAFGGLYIFKDLPSGKPLMIYEDNSSELSNNMKHSHVEFNLNDESFIPYMFNLNLLSSSPDFFVEQGWLLELQLDHMVVSSALEMDPEAKVDQLSKTQRKGLVQKLNKEGLLPKSYFDLEQLINKLSTGSSKGIKFPDHLNHNLLQPNSSCSREQKAVIWQLIAKIQNNNPILLYTFDKSAFYSQYQEWSEPMQRWTINTIQKHKDVFSSLIETALE